MSNPVDNRKHLSENDLKLLKESALSEPELLAFSEHMADCSLCAGRFAECFGEDELLEVPAGFRENIVSRLKPDSDGRRQMLFYSIRVAVAACATLIFIFSGALNLIADLDSKIKGFGIKGHQVTSTVNVGFQDLSKKLFHLEVFVNENEKK